mgnify:CR=1 FL=1
MDAGEPVTALEDRIDPVGPGDQEEGLPGESPIFEAPSEIPVKKASRERGSVPPKTAGEEAGKPFRGQLAGRRQPRRTRKPPARLGRQDCVQAETEEEPDGESSPEIQAQAL